MSRVMTKWESKFINRLYESCNVQKSRRGNRSLYNKLSFLFDKYPTAKKVSLEKPIGNSRSQINNARLIRIFKKRGKIVRAGYVRNTSKKILTGFWVGKTKGLIIKPVKEGDILSGSKEKSIILFKIFDTDLLIIGNRERLIKAINNSFGYSYAKEQKTICEANPDEKLKELIKIEEKEPQIHLYEVQYKDISEGKKLRVRAYSDSGAILNKFFELNFLNKESKNDVKEIISLHFTNKKQRTVLKVTHSNENQYTLRWKQENDLSNQIADLTKISNSSTLLMDSKNEVKLLTDLFRNEKLDFVDIRTIYKRILNEYSDYVKVQDNVVELRYRNIYATIRNHASKLGYKVRKISLKRSGEFYFINKTDKMPHYHMLRFTKDNRILQHVLLDHENMYWLGNEETIKHFFTFSPFIILDFRKNLKSEFESSRPNDYTVSSGEFLYELKNNPQGLLKMITEQGRTIIESFNLDSHYKIACGLLDKLDSLKLTSQQKGELFESICFIILSKMFLTKRLGGSLKADGKFILDDEKIVYDAKNISPETSFIKSVSRYGKVKDIDYIKNENTQKYIYIATHLDDKDFEYVKEKISAAIPTCAVSAITVEAIKDLVKIYDPRLISLEKLKNKMFSGGITKNFSKESILTDSSGLN